MPDSTARPERLAGSTALLRLATGFGVAFAFVALTSGPGDPGPGVPGSLRVDEIDVAYLRARAASGEDVGPEVAARMRRLIDADRAARAQALLDAFPSVAIGPRYAFALELQRATDALVDARGTGPVGAPRSGAGAGEGTDDPAPALARLLERLADDASLHAAPTLARGARLSRLLDEPALTATLHARLAGVDASGAPDAWAACGRHAAAAGARLLSIDCYSEAIDALAARGGEGVDPDAGTVRDGPKAFDLRLALLGQLVGDEHAVARDVTVAALVAEADPGAGSGTDPDAASDGTSGGPVDARRLERLARALLGAERPGAAATVHGYLAEVDPENRLRWWSEAARWSEAAGRPAVAATWVDRMRDEAPAAARGALARRGDALLVAAGRQDRVLERVAARIEASPGDAGALREGVRLARAGADLERARGWTEALLERRPDDVEALGDAIDLALAAGDLDGARVAAERAVHRLPERRPLRTRLAQVAEWSGDPEAATEQWRVIAGDGDDAETLGQLVRLARLTLRPEVAADAATRLALLEPPSPGDVALVVELHELGGRPDRAVAALESIMEAHGPEAPALDALAALHERHGRPARALDALERRARLDAGAGTGAPDVGTTLARLRLHWRLGERDAAGRVARELRGRPLDDVDGPTARLLSEIAWRERTTWLAVAAAPGIARMEDPDDRLVYGDLLVRSLAEAGRIAGAIAAADDLWRATGQNDFALDAMSLAVESGDADAARVYLAAGALRPDLAAEPAYWTAAAALRLGDDEPDAARRDLERALALDPEDVATLASLLWVLIDAGERDELERALTEHEARADIEPALWSVYALGWLGLDEPARSVRWFERLSDRIGTDYGLVLGYADALERVGRIDDALRLRRHALGELRPALVRALDAQDGGGDALLRRYVELVAAHGTLDERWSGALLGETGMHPGARARWREDVVIAWLLSSERHEHARALMARVHGARAAVPAWQRLSLALADDDPAAVRTLLDEGATLSAADRILALRAVNDETRAYALARDVRRSGATPAVRDFAASQYAELRASRPNWAEGFVRRSALGALGATETGVRARHTFAGTDTGLELLVARRTLGLDGTGLDPIGGGAGEAGSERGSDVSLALHRGDSRRGARLELGIDSNEVDDLVRGGAGGYLRSRDGRSSVSGELVAGEPGTGAPALVARARTIRASVSAERALGAREYARLGLDARDVRTRDGAERVARGASASLELGVRGGVGGSAWSGHVRASHARHDGPDTVPEALGLGADAPLDELVQPRDTTLELGGAVVGGGGPEADYPATGGPRWRAEARVDHAWPERTFGLKVDTGLGLRVLGDDELRFTLSHDTRASSASGLDASTLGVGYRFHF